MSVLLLLLCYYYYVKPFKQNERNNSDPRRPSLHTPTPIVVPTRIQYNIRVCMRLWLFYGGDNNNGRRTRVGFAVVVSETVFSSRKSALVGNERTRAATDAARNRTDLETRRRDV